MPFRTGLNLLIFRRFDSSLGWPLTTDDLSMDLSVLLPYYRTYYRMVKNCCINRRNDWFPELLMLSPPFSCWNGSWLRYQYLPSLMSTDYLGLKLMLLNGPLVACSGRVVVMAYSTWLPKQQYKMTRLLCVWKVLVMCTRITKVRRRAGLWQDPSQQKWQTGKLCRSRWKDRWNLYLEMRSLIIEEEKISSSSSSFSSDYLFCLRAADSLGRNIFRTTSMIL